MRPDSPLNKPILLAPEYRDYLWGGNRLKPGSAPIAEAWAIYENDLVASGPLAGCSLAEIAHEFGPDLLGSRVVQRSGERFPLLVKLLDCAQWLSLQVHPNDEQAARLEGPGFFGKTEAWHVLEAAPGAQLIAGMKPGTSAEALAEAIRKGAVLDWVQYLSIHSGDTVFVRAGTIHALGPGLLIYEVQQTSDLTYRVFDWNRPQTGNRVLHIEKSLAVANPAASANAEPLPPLQDGIIITLCQCPYFTLQTIAASAHTLELDTRGETFHALTVIEGSARLLVGGNVRVLNRFESAVIPAGVGRYTLEPASRYRLLKSSVES